MFAGRGQRPRPTGSHHLAHRLQDPLSLLCVQGKQQRFPVHGGHGVARRAERRLEVAHVRRQTMLSGKGTAQRVLAYFKAGGLEYVLMPRKY